jgi:hypothetical protein
MSEINANFVVQPFGITVTPEAPGITVSPVTTSLNVFSLGYAQPAGNTGQLQFNLNGQALGGAANTLASNGNVRFTNISNLKINGGANAYFLQTDGTGNLTWAQGTANVSGNGTAAGANTQIQITDGTGNFTSGAGFTFDNVTNLFSVPGNVFIAGNIADANITNALIGNTANFAGNVNASFYFGDGGLLSNVSGGAFISNGTSNARIYTADGNVEISINGISNISSFTSNGLTTNDITANDITANNVSGNTLTGSLTTSTQSNILVVGQLTGLTLATNTSLTLQGTNSNINGANLITANFANITSNLTSGNANLGNLAIANFVNVATNVNVTGTMQAGNVRTDNLLYANGVPWDLEQPAGSNTQIQFNDDNDFGASANLTFNKTTNVLSTFYLQVNSSNITLGSNAGPNQSSGAIAIGANAGNLVQGTSAIAIGASTGSNQTSGAIAIGANAGSHAQGTNAIAIGNAAGNNQSGNSIAIGNLAGSNSQAIRTIAIGEQAGVTQGQDCIAIGSSAGKNTNGTLYNIAIGGGAGNVPAGSGTISIGTGAGANQSEGAIAIGSSAQGTSPGAAPGPGAHSIGIGFSAGSANQGQYSVALGYNAGNLNLGNNSIAIGRGAGNANLACNSILLNATGSNFTGNTSNAFYVKPIRNIQTLEVLNYNSVTGEITNAVNNKLNNSFDTSNITIDSNSNVGIQFKVGTANNKLQITSAAANFNVPVNITGDTSINFANISNANIVNANITTGNITTAFLTNANITTGNITTINSGLLKNGNSNITLTANGNISLTVNNSSNVYTFGTNSANFGNANIEANVGRFTEIQCNVDISTLGNVNAAGNISTQQFLIGDGTYISNLSVGAGTEIINGDSNVKVYSNANVAISINGTTNVHVFTGTGALLGNNVSANFFTGRLLGAANTVATNAQPNITSVGTLTSLTVTGTINAGNLRANTGQLFANNANISGTIFLYANGNITGTSLSVTGNISANNANITNDTVTKYIKQNLTTINTTPGITYNFASNVEQYIKINMSANGGFTILTLNCANLDEAGFGKTYKILVFNNTGLNCTVQTSNLAQVNPAQVLANGKYGMLEVNTWGTDGSGVWQWGNLS